MITFTRLRFLALLLAIMPIACADFLETPEISRMRVAELNLAIEEVAGALDETLRQFDREGKSIAVATFVNLDDLESTSAFGRYMPEQLAANLHRRGFEVRELRQRINISHIPKTGEMALSRNKSELMKKFRVDALLIGAYSRVGSTVVVNARLVSVHTSRVISVGQMTLYAGPRTYARRLLDRASRGTRPTIMVYGG